jgi:uncharacterized membrane protein
MSKPDSPLTVMAAVYASEIDADLTLATLKQMDKDGEIEIHDAAVLVREGLSDKLKIKETAELTAKKGALGGVLAGGILAIIFPPSILAMGAIGAAAGAALGHFTDQGFKNNLLKEIGEGLPRGGSAIIAVIEERWAEKFAEVVKGYGKVTSYSLDAEASARLMGKRK